MLASIQGAIHNQDSRALEHAAHTFRGAAGNFGIQCVVDLAAQLETIARTNTLVDAETLGHALNGEMARVTPFLSAFRNEIAA